MIRYHARWVLPISRDPIANGTVCESGGRITYVGPRDGAPPGEDRELGNAYLMPGLVNAHTHLELTAFRGLISAPTFRDWIVTLQAAKTAVMTRERYLDSARAGIAEGLRAGITTYADTCDSGVALEAMREAGVRGIMYQEVFGPDPAQVIESMRVLEAKLAQLDPLATDLQRVGVSPHAPYTVSDELFRRVAALGRPMAIHTSETTAETELIARGMGPFAVALRARLIAVAPRASTPVMLLEKLGVLDAKPLLIHCLRVTLADLNAIAAHDCSIAHCPCSNDWFAPRTAPLAEMLELGIRTGLGSDSMASNVRMDILEEAARATLNQAGRREGSGRFTIERPIELATLGGARALGLGERIGSLEVGKDADLAAFAAAPGLYSVDDLIFADAPHRALAVVISGTVKLWDHTLLNDDPTLADRIGKISTALKEFRASS